MRSAHYVLILGHSDDAHAHLGGIIWKILDPLFGQILGVDMVSELVIKNNSPASFSHSK